MCLCRRGAVLVGAALTERCGCLRSCAGCCGCFAVPPCLHSLSWFGTSAMSCPKPTQACGPHWVATSHDCSTLRLTACPPRLTCLHPLTSGPPAGGRPLLGGHQPRECVALAGAGAADAHPLHLPRLLWICQRGGGGRGRAAGRGAAAWCGSGQGKEAIASSAVRMEEMAVALGGPAAQAGRVKLVACTPPAHSLAGPRSSLANRRNGDGAA